MQGKVKLRNKHTKSTPVQPSVQSLVVPKSIKNNFALDAKLNQQSNPNLLLKRILK